MKTYLIIPTADILTKLPRGPMERALERFDALSVKVSDGHRAFQPVRAEKIIKTFRDVNPNAEVWGWGWQKCHTEQMAQLEARTASKLCRDHELDLYAADLEIGWSGSKDRGTKYPDPYGNSIAFAKEFKQGTQAKLAANVFTWKTNSWGQKLHDADSMEHFDMWMPMQHGTSRDAIEKHWMRKNYVYPGMVIAPQIGVGRVDKNGKVWGFWHTRGQVEGYRDLLYRTRPQWVGFYLGYGGGERLIKDSKHYPSVASCVDELNDTLEEWKRWEE